MITIKSVELVHSTSLKVKYEVWGQKDEKTGVSANVLITANPGSVNFSVDFGEGKTKAVNEAFNKLAEWMEVISREIRERKTDGDKLPLFTQ